METTTTLWVAGCALALLIGIFAGYTLGSRKAKRSRRDMQRSMSEQSLELLDAKTKNRHLARFLGDAQRKDRLLKLTLNKLKQGNQTIHSLKKSQQDAERAHFIEMSRLNVAAVESRQQAKRAASVARVASFRLRLLEQALPQLQTIEAHEPKSYGQGKPVTVSVVDKHGPAAKREQAAAVSNRDLHRLTAMQSSNEQVRTPPDNTVSFPPAATHAEQKTIEPVSTEQRLRKKETIKRAT